MSWDTAEQDCLPAEDARGKLFDEILEQLAACDLFSNTALGQPTIFPVYAHDNEHVGTAHATCVHDLISWLQKIKAGILSDKSALPPLTSDLEDTSAQRNIIANQIRLLPIRSDSRSDEAAKCIDKVIVCGSEVLERYCRTPYSSKYIDDVVNICDSRDGHSMKTLKSRIENFVHGETGKDGHHHVLTEIAFLRLRKSRLPDRHGMVPVALDGAHHIPYLSVFRDSDITFKLKSTSAPAKHALFFQLLEQIFVEHKDLVSGFKYCYKKVVEDLKLDESDDVSRAHFHNCLTSNMTRMYYQHWSTFSTAMRNGRFNEYTGILARNVLQILDENRGKERRAILQWVSPMAAPPMRGKPEYQDGRAKHLDGTCDWVVKDEQFLEWYGSEKSAIISLQGTMGMGKTYATSRVIEWIQQSLSESQHHNALVYFYCIEQDEIRSNATAIMRNIVRQAASGHGEDVPLDEAIVDMWRKHGQNGQRYDTSTFDEWEDCLSKLINSYHGSMIVLDALDECKSAQRMELTDLFTSLAQRCPNLKIFVSTRPEPGLSQWLDRQPSISMHNGRTFGDIATFVQQKLAEHSEWLHIAHELKELLLKTIVDKSQGLFLCAHLQIENLQDCLYEEDIRDGLSNLPLKLTELYEKLYLRAMTQPAEKRLRDRALRWVLCSLKPLTSDELLFAICQDPQLDQLTETRGKVTERLLLKSCHNFLTLDSSNTDRESLRYSTWGMEEPGVPVWRLAHQAVAEFFQTSASFAQERAEMHYEAGKVCLMTVLDTFGRSAAQGRNRDRYSCLPCQKGTDLEVSLETEARHTMLQGPLVEYAIHAWPTHMRTHENQDFHSNLSLSQMLLRFLNDPRDGCLIYERWLEHASWVKDYLPWSAVSQRRLPMRGEKLNHMSLTNFVCYLGFPQTLAELLNSAGPEKATPYDAQMWSPWDADWIRSSNVMRSLRWSPVALACIHDEAKVLQCLLSTELAAQLGTFAADEVPPIVAAAMGNSVQAARELLRCQRGVPMDSSFTNKHGSVLRFALWGDSLQVLPLLLDRLLRDSPRLEEALSSVQRSDFRSAKSISLLLDKGVEANTPLKDGTLLAAAAYIGEEGLVDELLNKGADVNKQFYHQASEGVWDVENALEACLRYGLGDPHTSVPVARLLVKRGARVTARAVAIVAEKMRPPRKHWYLHRRVKREEFLRDVMRLLVANIVNPNLNEVCQTQFGLPTCALREAARIGSVADTKLLLENGANPNLSPDGARGWLLVTVFRETLSRIMVDPYPTRELVELLDKAGANFGNLEDDGLNIALAAAAWAGLTNLVSFLLRRGADPNAPIDCRFITALGAASASGQPEAPGIIAMLVDKVDVNLRHSDYRHLRDFNFSCKWEFAFDFPLWLMIDEETNSAFQEPSHVGCLRNSKLGSVGLRSRVKWCSLGRRLFTMETMSERGAARIRDAGGRNS